jgi:hypothetical protein
MFWRLRSNISILKNFASNGGQNDCLKLVKGEAQYTHLQSFSLHVKNTVIKLTGLFNYSYTIERSGGPENSNKFIAKRERETERDIIKGTIYVAMTKYKINVYM